jgi:hypothetical protein
MLGEENVALRSESVPCLCCGRFMCAPPGYDFTGDFKFADSPWKKRDTRQGVSETWHNTFCDSLCMQPFSVHFLILRARF